MSRREDKSTLRSQMFQSNPWTFLLLGKTALLLALPPHSANVFWFVSVGSPPQQQNLHNVYLKCLFLSLTTWRRFVLQESDNMTESIPERIDLFIKFCREICFVTRKVSFEEKSHSKITRRVVTVVASSRIESVKCSAMTLEINSPSSPDSSLQLSDSLATIVFLQQLTSCKISEQGFFS